MKKIRYFERIFCFIPLNYEQKSPSEYVYTPSGKVYSVGCDRRCKLIFVRSERFFRTPPCALILYVEFFYSPFFNTNKLPDSRYTVGEKK